MGYGSTTLHKKKRLLIGMAVILDEAMVMVAEETKLPVEAKVTLGVGPA